MKKEYIKNVVLIGLISTISISCTSQRYYKKVKNSIDEFDRIVNYIKDNKLPAIKDSMVRSKELGNKHEINICFYVEDIEDSSLVKFMRKFDLKRICFSKYQNDFFDSVITFHKDFNPILGKAVIITYDFDNSELRNRVKKGEGIKDEKVKIINSLYLYRLKLKPAFGE